jgi:uncharacterized integral membrane protein (TIGR00698 family)
MAVVVEAAAGAAPAGRAPVRRSRWAPGLALATGLALPATAVGAFLPLLGAPAAGMVAGIVAGAVLRRHRPRGFDRCRPGLGVAGRDLLQAAVVVLGLSLPLREVAEVGLASLPVLLGTLLVAWASAWLLGRLLRLHPETRLLIGVGTAICGASAIAAVTSVVRPAPHRVAYALGTIFTFNVAAVAAYPALGHLLGLSERAFGLWAGTAINDTSSVVAAAYAFGSTAGTLAVVVKLGRSLMIVPVCLVLGLRRNARRPGERARFSRAFPPFVLAFLAMSAIATAGLVPGAWRPAVAPLSTFLVTIALAGIGTTLDVRAMRAAGPRPLLFGGALGVAVGAGGLGLQLLTGQI